MSDFFIQSDILSWGRMPRTIMRVAKPGFVDELDDLIRREADDANGVLACGLLRSYGDSCINTNGRLINMTGLDRFINFDRMTGVMEVESGVSLKDILAVAIPAGFMLPVTPGTKFVTIGGAVANDVHGKNHHVAGTFGRFIRQVTLLRSDGTERVITRADDTGLFAATIGGLGLTGIITRVTLELKPITSSEMDVETIRFGDLSEFFTLAAESEVSHDYTVCVG